MVERTVEVVNPLGLHARAAAQLVRLAGGFASEIILYRDSKGIAANAKSILSVLHIAAPFGSVLRITTDGTDEDEAMDSVVSLFASGFGEI